ncbi:pesticin domain protein [Naegleria gruberi]|uniref:Pesticin domain protein n=1 Tax=Naegleria gruberi TaxID=5762 RepID=D2VKR0_NAEGR|nr:pesticin domain protein [Naegleria gruberi]EFC42738.1 pesticin domain protein [Naegleria gruberi]|eukprot:XP_002675482.1 pesticin domain protein [Naegleria gruberi strain NEG-M]
MKKLSFTILCCLAILSVSIIAVSASSSFLAEIVELADSYKGGSSGGGGGGGSGGGRGGSGGSRGGGSRGGSSGSRGGSRGGRSSGQSGRSGRSGRSNGRSSGGKSNGRSSGKTGRSGPSSKSTKSNKGLAGRMAGRTRTAGLKAAQARASLSKLANSITSKFSKVSPTLSKAFTGLVGPNMAKAFSAMAKAAAVNVKGPRVNSLTARFNAAFAAQPAVTGKLTAAAIQTSVKNRALAQQPAAASVATVSGYKIDKGLLTKNEAFSTKGYVPQSKSGTVVGKSGVTVGTGFDIGQQNVKGLKSLGLSPSLVDKLSPYTGLKQQAAKNFLSKNPLSLSPAEAKAIDKAVMDKSLASLAKDYEAAAAKNPNAVKNFKDLPSSVQSVAYSVQHQYGSIKKATPGFFGQLTKNDYKGMVNNLRNFGDKYSTRRNREADHLESGLKGASG